MHRKQKGTMRTKKQLANLRPDAAIKHGATTTSVRQRGEVPDDFRYLQPTIDYFFGQWVEDLGGKDQVSGAQEALLVSSRICLAILLLSAEHIRNHGLVDGKGNPQPILKIAATYANSLRLNLNSIGLQRVAKKADSLEGYLEERYGDKGTSQQAAQKPPRKESRK